jgi:hypothetical protein
MEQILEQIGVLIGCFGVSVFTMIGIFFYVVIADRKSELVKAED